MPLTKVASSMLASGTSGSGGSAGKNYISSYNGNSCNGDFESGSISGWNVCSVTGFTNGVPNSAATIISSPGVSDPALSLLSSGQLAGQFSLQTVFPTTAVNEGFISDIFTIDAEDQAKVLTFKFYYNLSSSSGTVNFSGTSSNAFLVAIYDQTNLAWIQPAGLYSMTQSSGTGIATGTFQTTSNSTQYRFAIFCASVTGWTGSATLKFDDFSVGPLTAPIGPVMGDWVDRGTMTIGAVTTAPTKGTASVDKVLMRRVGDSAQFLYEYSQTVAGAAGSGTYLFSLPSGMSIDTTKIPITVGGFIRSAAYSVGQGNASIDSGNGVNGNITVYPYSSTQVALFVSSSQNTSGTGGSGVDESISNSNYALSDSVASYKFWFTVPIAGWSSNVQMSNDTDTRVVACRVGPSSSISIASGSTTAQYTGITTVFDTHGAFSGGTTYTVPVAGVYRISARASFNATGGAGQGQEIVRIYSGATLIGTLAHRDVIAAEAAGVTSYIAGSNTFSFSAGEALTFRGYQDCGVTRTSCQLVELSIERLSGPSVIAATETVTAQAASSAGTVLSNGNTIVFGTENWDSHSTYDPATGIFTAPVSGTYEVSACVQSINFTPTAGNQYALNVCRDGTTTTYQIAFVTANAAVTQVIVLTGTTQIKLNAGQTVRITISISSGTFTLLNVVTTNVLNIKRVGN